LLVQPRILLSEHLRQKWGYRGQFDAYRALTKEFLVRAWSAGQRIDGGAPE
jgi:hypothetical protein